MISEITGAFQSAKLAVDLVKSATGLANHNDVLMAVSAVQAKLADAMASELQSLEKQRDLSTRLHELERKLAEVEDWSAQIKRYSLTKLPSSALAYALKPEFTAVEPMHYLCASCMDKKQRSMMQPSGRRLLCNACDSNIAFESEPPLQPIKYSKAVRY